ncbi:MAG: 30S ribosomal protein S3 [Candidatus Kerfeldbacteria bacterium CG08_land_8_20_14_0_20_42_7]|uniref:Small ribosomal subunit protein uS3 n=1 Tax=Candidatus Kerfeldbacteria bacterium CG08_land_8_20_14_0_20_42_7 TaxID=2014245 RepID=A0A2H0YT14_9BACT|nr:MAG: 30S ribosomal protein S3 [Candidatus Kerfeldbacteria bacterium CG08_land_8_20_14_0_20_42_7]
MGQKVHPYAFRIPILRTWSSRWFAKKDYALLLKEDISIREYLKKKLKKSSVSDILIERSAETLNISIFTSKPGLVIGRGGGGIEDLTNDLKKKFFASKKITLKIAIQEVTKPMLSAELVAQNMAEQLEKRIPFRRVLKTSLDQIMRGGALGAKVCVAGRLNGADIARTEKLHQGKVPLHTLRADIDYASVTAATTFGSLGIKVWIYKGEVFQKDEKKN